jgi:crossover junction endodeoxyribonuclease RuvC
MPRILGIDPGLGGALALWDSDLELLWVQDMPVHIIKVGKSSKCVLDEVTLADWVRELLPNLAVCEWVHAMPKQGVTSVFTFGVAFGVVRGVLAALHIPVTYITPQSWQRTMKVPQGKDGSRQRATQLLPRYGDRFVRVRDNGRSDATLIALASV